MASGMMSRFDEHFNELNPDTAFALGVAQQFTGVDYFQAQKQRTRAMVFLEKIFKKVDCIITPGLGMKVPVIAKDALKHGEANTMMMGKMMRFMSLGNLTGIPGMTFPVGYDVNDLPISLQVMSGWWQEHMMLRVANTCEGLVEHQKPQVYYDIMREKKMDDK
ncbi:fatty acid amide hydrolase-like [Actinia tenebrosa]|uniref:Fatty acid amide hydrolase-like n=1 Tax=Actinia tenebrosa TaxID=6105 RepID=A0A6P8I1L1_ACTTE|nr:fatty acid amide hydrolase-like [Actinia tenebrosa]